MRATPPAASRSSPTSAPADSAASLVVERTSARSPGSPASSSSAASSSVSIAVSSALRTSGRARRTISMSSRRSRSIVLTPRLLYDPAGAAAPADHDRALPAGGPGRPGPRPGAGLVRRDQRQGRHQRRVHPDRRVPADHLLAVDASAPARQAQGRPQEGGEGARDQSPVAGRLVAALR